MLNEECPVQDFFCFGSGLKAGHWGDWSSWSKAGLCLGVEEKM